MSVLDAGPREPFRPSELGGSPELIDGAAARAELLMTARELERLAASGDVLPGPDFADRVVAAIAREPLPRPTIAAGAAIRGGRGRDLVAAIADSWRIAWSGNRPLAVRTQGAALALVVVVALASVGGLAAVGAWSAFGPRADRTPLPVAIPTSLPSSSPEAMPSAEPSPSLERTETPKSSPRPSRSPKPTSRATTAPTDTPDSSDDHDDSCAVTPEWP